MNFDIYTRMIISIPIIFIYGGLAKIFGYGIIVIWGLFVALGGLFFVYGPMGKFWISCKIVYVCSMLLILPLTLTSFNSEGMILPILPYPIIIFTWLSFITIIVLLPLTIGNIVENIKNRKKHA